MYDCAVQDLGFCERCPPLTHNPSSRVRPTRDKVLERLTFGGAERAYVRNRADPVAPDHPETIPQFAPADGGPDVAPEPDPKGMQANGTPPPFPRAACIRR